MSNINSPAGTAGTNPTNAIPVSSPSLSATEEFTTFQDVDSDSEGGMQLDPTEDDPDQDFDFEQAHGHGLPLTFTGAEIEYDPHAWEDTRDESHFRTIAPNPSTHATPLRMQSAEEQRGRITRPRHRLREEEHAALAVLDDWELLVTYAVKNGLTIPQTRRRFTAKLLAPDDKALEDELYGARFVIPASRSELLPSFSPGGNTSRSGGSAGGNGGGARPERATGNGGATAYLVPGVWKEILTEEVDGWFGVGRVPVKTRRKGSKELERGGSGNRSGGGSGRSSVCL